MVKVTLTHKEAEEILRHLRGRASNLKASTLPEDAEALAYLNLLIGIIQHAIDTSPRSLSSL